jgi:hypothetical protein
MKRSIVETKINAPQTAHILPKIFFKICKAVVLVLKFPVNRIHTVFHKISIGL